MEAGSDRLVRNMHMSSFGCAPLVPPHKKEQILAQLLG